MKKFYFLLMTVVALFVSQSTIAQDIILKTDDSLIKCKIKEIGLDEIKYTLTDYPDHVVFSLDKDHISKITFENGKEMTFQKEMTNPENYKDNKKNALKIGFLSPLTGSTSFSYERSLRPGRSLEATLGIIGLGLDPDDRNPGGAFLKFGYKFIKDPDYYLRGMRYAHILKGGYIKPELALAIFSRDGITYYDTYPYYGHESRSNIVSGAVQLVFGKQWVFDNVFLVDLYGGIGYGFSSGDESDENFYHYGYIFTSNEFPMAFSGGLKIGFLFK